MTQLDEGQTLETVEESINKPQDETYLQKKTREAQVYTKVMNEVSFLDFIVLTNEGCIGCARKLPRREDVCA